MSENINGLISRLSQQLGTSPEELSDAAKNGDIGAVLKNSQNPRAQEASRVLSDPEQTKKLLQSPQAQALMKMLGGEK
ncbi:MAG: hypothetical protein UFA98_05715 [Ruminococcus sp.]|nr:hypothetical protein [Ruminococcus sp.]